MTHMTAPQDPNSSSLKKTTMAQSVDGGSVGNQRRPWHTLQPRNHSLPDTNMTNKKNHERPSWSSPSLFMQQVEETVSNVLQHYGELSSSLENENDEETTSRRRRRRRATGRRITSRVDDIPPEGREAILIARCLQGRLQNARHQNVCPHCWLQRPSCACDQCPPVENAVSTATSGVRRIFLILHYRELFMGVDTAKLILRTFPHNCRLVIAGIPACFQASMAELEQALSKERMNGHPDGPPSSGTKKRCCVLFPDQAARTIGELENDFQQQQQEQSRITNTTNNIRLGNDTSSEGWDVVVIDGTWQQARRIKLRYFPEASVPTVKLSPAALSLLLMQENELDDHNGTDNKNTDVEEDYCHVETRTERQQGTQLLPAKGHQLRKHSIPWKRIATFEALRLFIVDCSVLQTSTCSCSTTNSKQDEGMANIASTTNIPDWLVQIQDYVRIANQATMSQNHKEVAACPRPAVEARNDCV